MNGSSEQESWFPEAVSEEVFTFRGERKAETRHKAGDCPARTQGCSLSLASQWATLNRWVHSALRASQTRLQTGVVRGQSALLRKPAGTVSSKATCYRLGDLSAVNGVVIAPVCRGAVRAEGVAAGKGSAQALAQSEHVPVQGWYWVCTHRPHRRTHRRTHRDVRANKRACLPQTHTDTHSHRHTKTRIHGNIHTPSQTHTDACTCIYTNTRGLSKSTQRPHTHNRAHLTHTETHVRAPHTLPTWKHTDSPHNRPSQRHPDTHTTPVQTQTQHIDTHTKICAGRLASTDAYVHTDRPQILPQPQPPPPEAPVQTLTLTDTHRHACSCFFLCSSSDQRGPGVLPGVL